MCVVLAAKATGIRKLVRRLPCLREGQGRRHERVCWDLQSGEERWRTNVKGRSGDGLSAAEEARC